MNILCAVISKSKEPLKVPESRFNTGLRPVKSGSTPDYYDCWISK
jgi:hypothetical protein